MPRPHALCDTDVIVPALLLAASATPTAADEAQRAEAGAFLAAMADEGKMALDSAVSGAAGSPPHRVDNVVQTGCVSEFQVAGAKVMVNWPTVRSLTWITDDGRSGFVAVDHLYFRFASLGDAGLVAQTFGFLGGSCRPSDR